MSNPIRVINDDEQSISISNSALQRNISLANDPTTVIGDHERLTNKNAPNQHEINAITGLQEALDNIVQDKSYIHRQMSAASTWHIIHNLGKFASVSVVDSGGSVVYGDVTYIDENVLEVKFNGQFSGKAYLN